MLGPFDHSGRGGGNGRRPSKLSVSASLGRSTSQSTARTISKAKSISPRRSRRREQGQDREAGNRQDRSKYVFMVRSARGPSKASDRRPIASSWRATVRRPRPKGPPSRRSTSRRAWPAPTIQPPSVSRVQPRRSHQQRRVPAEGSVDFVDGKPPGVELAVTLPRTVDQPRQAALAVYRGGQRPPLGDGQSVWWAAHQRPAAIPRAARPHRQWRSLVGRRGVRPRRHRRYAFRHHRRLPPMRDALGSVDFRGNDVDVALSSAAVFCPTARVFRRTGASPSATPIWTGHRQSGYRHRRRGLRGHAARLL